MKKNILVTLLFVIITNPAPAISIPAPFIGNNQDGLRCIGNSKGYGPFDYSKRHTIRPYDLSIVEGAHFDSKVQNLTGGTKVAAQLVSDLTYTIRAWPNHHKALLSIIRLQIGIDKKLRKEKLSPRAECFLQRATHFSPKDPVPYSLYAYYLTKKGDLKKAKELYKKSLEIAPGNPKIEYNFSLLLIKLKQYDEALEYAKLAYLHGNPPKELKNKLRELNVWKNQ